MNKNKNIIGSLVKNGLIAVAVLAASHYVFAVTGIKLNTNSGDDKAKSADNVSAFSNIKSSVTFSLKDGYKISSKNKSKLGFISSSQEIKAQNSNTLVTFKKGNTVYVMPYKTQAGVKLPAFIKMSPSACAVR